MSTSRSSWGSNGGFLLAAIGSAIGLGNVWRFSYMAYQYGGGAFLVPYVVALFVAGIPIIIIEYGLGHKEKGSSPLSFARIGRRFEWLGWWMPVVAMFGIMLYYSVVIGWCINYLVFSFHLDWGADPQGFFFKQFLQISPSAAVIGGIRLPIALSTFLVWVSCWLICSRDIRHGIERASVVFMPVLFLLTIILVLWSVSLDGARDCHPESLPACRLVQNQYLRRRPGRAGRGRQGLGRSLRPDLFHPVSRLRDHDNLCQLPPRQE